MNYKETGNVFCKEINKSLEDLNINCAFVTGGGFAYDSIKYDEKTIGDFDFMIVFENQNDILKLIKKINQTHFNFEDKYLNLDIKLLRDNLIDIIRLSGEYNGIKSTINLVPKSLIITLSQLKTDIVIKKISHSRNTSLFFAYGSDKTRKMVNFISPQFVTKDGEDHYIHLDFSCKEFNDNIYFGILSDAILKGFNKNYDRIGFQQLRKNLINNIRNYFTKNGIPLDNYMYVFANNLYFAQQVKDLLLNEFHDEQYCKRQDETFIKEDYYDSPIFLTSSFDSECYNRESFNFIQNKNFSMNFVNYIKQKQDTEYDRQYLIDALGKFFGYIYFRKSKNIAEKSNKLFCNILQNIDVYGKNDLYLAGNKDYSDESIILSLICDLAKNKEWINEKLFNYYIVMCETFLSEFYSLNLSGSNNESKYIRINNKRGDI